MPLDLNRAGGSPGISGVPKKPAFGFLGWIYAGERGFQASRKKALRESISSLPVGQRAIGVPSKRRIGVPAKARFWRSRGEGVAVAGVKELLLLERSAQKMGKDVHCRG